MQEFRWERFVTSTPRRPPPRRRSLYRDALRFAASGVLSLTLLLRTQQVAVAKEKVVALYVEGPDARGVRTALRASVPSSAHVVDPEVFRSALASHGQKGPFGKQLDRRNRAVAISRLRGAVADTGADGALVARVVREKERRRVVLFFVDGSGATVEMDTVVLGPTKAAADDAKLASAVGTTLDGTRSEPQEANVLPAEKAAAETGPSFRPFAEPGGAAEDRGTSSERPRAILARSFLVAEVDGEAGGRNFRYNQPITGNLRSYDVLSAPVLRAAAEIFPLADVRLTGAGGFVRDLGIFGGYSRALLLKSSVKAGSSFDTDETAYMVGVRVRIHPAGDNGPIFGISDAYAVQSLTFAATGMAIDGELPAVQYAANRTGLDARIPFGRLAAFVGIGYRSVLDGGAVSKRFRGSSVNGVDAELGGAFALLPGWEARLVAHYERYFYAFRPRPGDAFVAGGALDQFFAARLGLAYVY